jgi:hypothetical protein
MNAIHIDSVIEKDGELHLTGLPFKKGQKVEMSVSPSETELPWLTTKELLNSGIVGIWEDRTDIGDSVEFARKLRKQAETRNHE